MTEQGNVNWEKPTDPPGFNSLQGLNPVVAARLKKEKEEAAKREQEKLNKNLKDKAGGSSVQASSDVVPQTDDAEVMTKGDFRKVLGQMNDSFNLIEASIERSDKIMALMARFSKEILEIVDKPKK